jgi:hypothetical protein
MYLATIETLAAQAVDARDQVTHDHSTNYRRTRCGSRVS